MSTTQPQPIFDNEWSIIFDSLPDGICLLDKDLMMVRHNRALGHIMPLDADRLKSENLRDYLASLNYQHTPIALQLVKETCQPQYRESFDHHGNWFRIAAQPILNGHEFLGVVFSLSDVTSRKRAEDEVERSEERFRQMANAIPQLAWMTDAAGQTTWYNQRFYDYTGYTFKTMSDKERVKIHHPDYYKDFMQYRDAMVTKGEKWEATFPLRGKDGDYRWFLAGAMPMQDDKGKILRWFGTATDITDQRLLENTLREAKEKAEEANLAKSEFLANMSHEIRTPMNVVIGLANILAVSVPLTPQQKEFIKTLQLSADTLLALINDLLDISKIESRSFELEQIQFNFYDLMKEIINILSVRAVEKNLSLMTDIESIRHKNFIGDTTRLRQIIMNLCSNAIKFTTQGIVNIKIHTEPGAQKNSENIVIAVSDTGIGIAEEKREAIFQKFIQADTSINRHYGGTGLGLAITKSLVENMHGSVTLDSTMGQGSTFTVILPLTIAKEKKPAAAVHYPTASIIQFDKLEQPANAPLILLVEDYAPNILVATTILEHFGYRYEVANNGHEAIEKATAHIYDAILMDVQMPNMNGLEATAQIRQHEKMHNLPPISIIGMTAYALAGDREKCLSAGMTDYISKPFNQDELKRKLDRELRQKAALNKNVI